MELRSTTVTCKPIYGFLPCTTAVWGQLLLLAFYEYLISFSDYYLSTGSELLFQAFGTGIFGACFCQVLPFFPQVILVVVTTITSTEKNVESSASMAMGIVAGSTILHVTLTWASVVAFGSYDLSRGCLYKKKPFSLIGYGVRVDYQTKSMARIMLLGSVVPLSILSIAEFIHSSDGKQVVVLVALIASLLLLFGYCIYQIFMPWIQRRRLEYLILMNDLQVNTLWRLLTAEGLPDEMKIKKLCNTIYMENNTGISVDELRALIFGVKIKEFGLDEDHFLSQVMQEFDLSGSATISESEFIKGISNWLNKITNEAYESLLPNKKAIRNATEKTWWNYIKFSYLLILGIAIAALLAKPLTSTIKDIATAFNMPSFFISYVEVPFYLRFRQALKAISSAKQKTDKSSSLTFSQIYSETFVSNVMGLSSFLMMVYIKNIPLDATIEVMVMVVLIICAMMGIFASLITTISFWTCILVYILYLMSLLTLYVSYY